MSEFSTTSGLPLHGDGGIGAGFGGISSMGNALWNGLNHGYDLAGRQMDFDKRFNTDGWSQMATNAQNRSTFAQNWNQGNQHFENGNNHPIAGMNNPMDQAANPFNRPQAHPQPAPPAGQPGQPTQPVWHPDGWVAPTMMRAPQAQQPAPTGPSFSQYGLNSAQISGITQPGATQPSLSGQNWLDMIGGM